MRYLLILLTGLMTVACSDRERANPLDSDNPITHGAPTGFLAMANRDTANLSWDPVEVNGLDGYLIYRSVGGDSLGFYDTVSAASTRFQDLNLTYDTTYAYAVQAVTEWGESHLSPPDTLIPGPYNFWIADFYNSAVWRISYDGAHVLGREYFYSPKAVVYQPGEGRVWVADYWDKAVYYMDVYFTRIEQIDLTGRPIDMAADTISGTIHVLQKFPDLIIHVSRDGTILDTLEAPDDAPDDVDIDAALAVDAAAGVLWFSNPVSPISGDIYRCDPFSSGGEWELMASLAYPRQIVADPAAGGCWVATDSGVVRIDIAGHLTSYLTDHRVLDISLNPDGDCYYVAKTDGGEQWVVGYLTGQPSPKLVTILNNDYPNLANIQVLPASVLPGEGQAGFLVSQGSTGRILRFDREGRLLGLLEGFDEFLRFTLE